MEEAPEPRAAGGPRGRGGFLHHLNRAEEYVAVAMLAVLGVLLAVQVTLRFAFGLGYGWMEEIARMLFLWVIFLGAVAAMRGNLHIRVEAGLLLFPKPIRGAVAALGDLALFAFCIAVTWHGIELCASTWSMNFRLQSTGVSMFWPYLILPLSFGLQALRLVLWRAGVRD
jgi:TRAP-type C4-dicarboxylate transport system permease small subunit